MQWQAGYARTCQEDAVSSTTPEDQLARIQAALFAGRKIEAIKLYREATGTDLAEAKERVEAMEAELRQGQPDRFAARPSGQGCMAVALVALTMAAVLAALIWLFGRMLGW